MSAPARRPVFLELRHITFPAGAIVSLLHRLSGVVLFLMLPAAIWLLEHSLMGAAGFAEAAHLLATPLGKGAIVLVAWALGHHLLAGIRLLLADVEIGLDRRSAKGGASAVIAGGVVIALLTLGVIW